MNDQDMAAVLGQMTLQEKASLLSGGDLWSTRTVDRLGVGPIVFSDGPHGLRFTPPVRDGNGATHTAPATCFPPEVALGSSWDADLLERVGAALGEEAAALGVDVVLGPGVNIKRSPLCGRNFEYLSEDPLLSGMLGAALIRGIQSAGVGASLKHFAVNNQETDRMRVSADVDERTLREIYLSAFERAVKDGEPWTVMSSYNRINGVYASEDEWLLTQVLRDDWGYDGLVVSDWGAVNDRVAALRAGLDLEMPTSGGRNDAEVVRAVLEGELEETVVDRAVGRILALLERSRRRAERANDGGAGPRDPDADARHHHLAREAAAQCMVLLKNDGVLPLSPGHSLAVIGELARTPRYQGDGSSRVVPTALSVPLEELRLAAGDAVPFAPGYRLDGQRDEVLEREACEIAGQASVTVVFLGLPEEWESEGFDRTGIRLPDQQLALLRALSASTSRLVVVLSNGGVVQVSEWEHLTGAVLEGWLLGQAGGGAIADVLFGMVNPSGRLAESIPQRLEDTASYLNFPGELGHVRYGEGVFVGYRYHDSIGGPVSYPFGHGLSYTTFDYRDLQVSTHGADEELQVSVELVLTNTGDRSGREVVQLYVRPPESLVRRPLRELRGFTKVHLEARASTTLRFQLGWRDFAFYDAAGGCWRVEPGEVGIDVGASSRDIRLQGAIEVDVMERPGVITADSSLAEWAASPNGWKLLERSMNKADGPRFLTEARLRTMGSFPLRRVARFPGAQLDFDALDDLVREVNGT